MDWELLSGLGDDDRRRVLAVTTRRRYARNEVLFHEGEPGTTIHLVERGHVALRATTPLGDEVLLNVVGPGVSFGVLALLDVEQLRTATAIALDAVETRTLHQADFERLCRDHPTVQAMLVRALADDVRRLSDQVVEFLFEPVDKRVLRRVAHLARAFADGGSTAEVPVSQETIAALAGTTRPTANRALRAAETDGLLELRRGRVLVPDVDALDAAT